MSSRIFFPRSKSGSYCPTHGTQRPIHMLMAVMRKEYCSSASEFRDTHLGVYHKINIRINAIQNCTSMGIQCCDFRFQSSRHLDSDERIDHRELSAILF